MERLYGISKEQHAYPLATPKTSSPLHLPSDVFPPLPNHSRLLIISHLDLAGKRQRSPDDVRCPLVRPNLYSCFLPKLEILDQISTKDQQLRFRKVLTGTHSLAPPKDMMALQTWMFGKWRFKIGGRGVEPAGGVVDGGRGRGVGAGVLRHGDVEYVDDGAAGKVVAGVGVVLRE